MLICYIAVLLLSATTTNFIKLLFNEVLLMTKNSHIGFVRASNAKNTYRAIVKDTDIQRGKCLPTHCIHC